MAFEEVSEREAIRLLVTTEAKYLHVYYVTTTGRRGEVRGTDMSGEGFWMKVVKPTLISEPDKAPEFQVKCRIPAKTVSLLVVRRRKILYRHDLIERDVNKRQPQIYEFTFGPFIDAGGHTAGYWHMPMGHYVS